MLLGLRVLIVEDVPMMREVLRAILEMEGARVHEAGTAREAIEMSRTHTFDVVLTDLGLPDVPGDVVITHFRVTSNGRTAVAVLSGAGESELARAARLGADRLFTKPLEWDELVEYLGAAGRSAWSRPAGSSLAQEREDFNAGIPDKEMPGPDGLDLLSFVRQRQPDVPVIVVTEAGITIAPFRAPSTSTQHATSRPAIDRPSDRCCARRPREAGDRGEECEPDGDDQPHGGPHTPRRVGKSAVDPT